MNNNRPTMADVAKRSGVSKSTVSYVLNGKPGISDQVRDKVLQACKEMNYRVNKNLQDFLRENISGITRNIALVLINIEFGDPSYARLIDGVAKGTMENNYHLSFAKLTGEEADVFDLPPVLRDGRVDGILVSGELNSKVLDVLRGLDIPVVVLGDYSPRLVGDTWCVGIDFSGVYARAVEILKEKGNRRIAYYTETLETYLDRESLHAYKQALVENDLTASDAIIYTGQGKLSGAFPVLTSIFFAEQLPFDAILCPEYRSAIEISHLMMARAWKYGVHDCILVTSRWYSYYKLPVPVIYIDADVNELAYEGVSLLLGMLEQDKTGRTQKVMINPSLEISGLP